MGTLDSQNVNGDVITNCDLKAYKRILDVTNAHLAGYEPGGDKQISRGAKYAKVIPKLLPQTRCDALRQHWSPFQNGRYSYVLLPPAPLHSQQYRISRLPRKQSRNAISSHGSCNRIHTHCTDQYLNDFVEICITSKT